MPRYLISFDDGSMDHISEHDLPSVGDAARKVVRQAKAAGVWIFGCGIHRQRSSIVDSDGTITDGRFRRQRQSSEGSRSSTSSHVKTH